MAISTAEVSSGGGSATGPVLRRASVWRVVEWNAYNSRRFWRSLAVVGVLTPLLYVVALGIGLGALVKQHGSNLLGVPYLVFVAPALLTAAALQIASGEASWPVMAGFKWIRQFHGMAATPLTPRQICDGTMIWIAIRLTINSALYLAIMAGFGAAQRWQIVFAAPAAVLCAMAFAAPVSALSASLVNEGQAFNVLFRFVVTPMFLFSGTFYPLSQLPAWGRWLAWISPLWHGTELARDASIGGLSASAVLGHVLYLLVWLVVGVVLARWRFTWRVTK